MENVVLTIHLILALLLIGVVLLQRSEGGGLGMGGSGSTMSARGAATALTKLTWIFASAFIVTSITLTVLSARSGVGGSVVDTETTETTTEAPATEVPATAEGGLAGTDLTLPGTATAPAAPPPADAPAAPPANP